MSDLEDRLAIFDLIARYSHTIDGRDYDAWVNCFVPEGTLVSAMGTSSGHSALRKFAADYEKARAKMPNARHFMTNIAVSIEGDTAKSRSYVQITTSEPKGVRVLFTGQYDDKLERVDGEWKFRERRGIPDTSVAESAAHRASQASGQ